MRVHQRAFMFTNAVVTVVNMSGLERAAGSACGEAGGSFR